MNPYCFVLMPFGEKRDENGRVINFDTVYDQLIRPAIEAADLTPIRADHESLGGIIHKAMFERLMLCDYAVADLTAANANVFYELGIRHAIRPHSTTLIFAEGARLPFDVAHLRCLPYQLDASGQPVAGAAGAGLLTEQLRTNRQRVEDSPFFHYVKEHVQDWPLPNLAAVKADLFRASVESTQQIRAKLRQAAQLGAPAITALADGLNLPDTEPALLVDLLKAYQAAKAWPEMIDLVPRLPPHVAEMVLVQELYGFALNRAGRRQDALEVLQALVARRGPSSETNGLIGRVYKDMRDDALAAGQTMAARGHLRRAIGAYVDGFQADWRDPYPGVNALTLMELSEPVDPRQADLIPVVRYAVQRKMAARAPDYWDHATLVELAVLGRTPHLAETALQDAMAMAPLPWMLESTAANLARIRLARTALGEDSAWIAGLEAELHAHI